MTLALPPPPLPPPGMGANPRFAPPVPRPDKTVLIVSIVLGVLLLLCCGGGLVGVGGLYYWGSSQVDKAAVTEVETYLGLLRAGRTDVAYARLCVPARSRQSLSDFVAGQSDNRQVVSFAIAPDAAMGTGGDEWLVTAEVRRAGDDGTRRESFPVVFDDSSQARVCPR